MCGIAGSLDARGQRNRADLEAVASAMAGTLSHRGPDGSGVWVDEQAGLALGHRRLAIIDLTDGGRQPMVSASGRYVITFNGEIYNFQKLRSELEVQGKAPAWRGHSDTEVMLAAIEAWGLDSAMRRFVGMFSFALWDRAERHLFLVRDRLGEKPLYYGWIGAVFLFGSELKALQAHPSWGGEIDPNALSLLLRYNYIPAPYSIFQGINKLMPGTMLKIKSGAPGHLPTPAHYWSAHTTAKAGLKEASVDVSEDETVDTLDTILREAIMQQMIADVPLGAFLSGGIDSSTVVALMQAQSDRPVKTFTIGFHEAAYNEAEAAKRVAEHLGTEHTEVYLTPQETMKVIPELPMLYDEPFADSSQIPTFLVARLARQHVTVSLSGDGGDELFGGYNRHVWGRRLSGVLRHVPSGIRRAGSRAITSISPQRWDSLFRGMAALAPTRLTETNAGDRLYKLGEILDGDPAAFYKETVSLWKDPESVVINSHEPMSSVTEDPALGGAHDLTARLMYLDMVNYLPNDILVKVDRASMGVSLEARVPFLDHRVVEFAWRIPMSMKIRDGVGKRVLRRLLSRYVPRALIERPKMGFGIPIDRWLRGPLRDWAETLLAEDRLQREGFFSAQPIREKWQEHLSGRRNWQYHLWGILMFQSWLEAQ
jgi:asparagine synthase (glutamine-hydrolysing)